MVRLTENWVGSPDQIFGALRQPDQQFADDAPVQGRSQSQGLRAVDQCLRR